MKIWIYNRCGRVNGSQRTGLDELCELGSDCYLKGILIALILKLLIEASVSLTRIFIAMFCHKDQTILHF